MRCFYANPGTVRGDDSQDRPRHLKTMWQWMQPAADPGPPNESVSLDSVFGQRGHRCPVSFEGGNQHGISFGQSEKVPFP